MAEQEYVLLKNNDIVNIIILDDPSEELMDLFKNDWNSDTIVPKNIYPGMPEPGGTLDNDIWFSKPPSSKWIKDYNQRMWVPNVPYPEDGQAYCWDEESGSWILIEQPI